MPEEWKQIEDYPMYEVSSCGRIRSWYKKGGSIREESYIMKQFKNLHGYKIISLVNDGVKKTISVSRIVGETFVEKPKDKDELNHIDGNKENNHVDNLEWVTRSENTQHSFDTGLRVNKGLKGDDNPNTKLSENDVLDIRNAYRLGVFTQKEIAKAYNVSRRHIGNIIQKKRWCYI